MTDYMIHYVIKTPKGKFWTAGTGGWDDIVGATKGAGIGAVGYGNFDGTVPATMADDVQCDVTIRMVADADGRPIVRPTFGRSVQILDRDYVSFSVMDGVAHPSSIWYMKKNFAYQTFPMVALGDGWAMHRDGDTTYVTRGFRAPGKANGGVISAIRGITL